MASVKIPKSAEPFLKFAANDNPNRMFETQAHLMMTAASIGFYESERGYGCEYAKKDPISLDVFRNKGLYNFLLTIVIDSANNVDEVPRLVDDESRVTKIFEEYADAGFNRMQLMHEEAGADSSFVDALAEYMLDAYDEASGE